MKHLLTLCGLLLIAALACQALSGALGQPPTQPAPSATPVSAVTLTPTDTPTPLPLTPTGAAATPTNPPSPSPTQGGDKTRLSKWALWVEGPHLRGANIYQRHVYPELDGPTFMGPGPLGPPFNQADFERMAEMGANYVNISHAGLFSETPPYTLDEDAQSNLDHLLEMIEGADLFAVISFRSGPGRSEFTFFWGEHGDWFTKDYYNDTVWKDEAAQQAWAEMWRYTAERYKDSPVVVGYDLMVEPNSNEVWFDEWDQEAFYAQHGGSSYDWNPLAQRISQAIRQVDTDTPILIGGMGYSGIEWLPYVQVTGDPRTVYTFHQYRPTEYAFQEAGETSYTYPGMFDLDWDGRVDAFDRDWLEGLLAISDEFAGQHGFPLAVNEFGLRRWAPGAADFLRDSMELFEARGLNYALWEWSSSWPEWTVKIDGMNYLHGPDPDNHAPVENELARVVRSFWGRNVYRPSNVVFKGRH